MTNEYTTVFEISHKGFTWWFALLGLLPAIPGAILWRMREHWQYSLRTKWVMCFFPAFALLWLSIGTIPMWREYTNLQRAYRLGNFSVVQGPVENFRPAPPQGHSDECFSVTNQTFCYAENVISAGFNNDSAHGGPIREGLPVRVSYIGEDILKLEVRTDALAK